jgi:hypothetical protein
MEHPSDLPPPAGGTAAPTDPRAQFQVEVHDHYANYSSAEWMFRGQPQTIKKALRITYRYPLLDSGGNSTGFYATEHLLIGYAGGNGGG